MISSIFQLDCGATTTSTDQMEPLTEHFLLLHHLSSSRKTSRRKTTEFRSLLTVAFGPAMVSCETPIRCTQQNEVEGLVFLLLVSYIIHSKTESWFLRSFKRRAVELD